MEHSNLWNQCLQRLEREISLEELNTWLRPLLPELRNSGGLRLMAPNDFVCDRVQREYLNLIRDFYANHGLPREAVVVAVGQAPPAAGTNKPQRSGASG
ncbi:MAG: DnaA N-terminal domain-containing protein, partial [Pseudomonadota bacterium]